ncbi:MAG: ECF transporter S component [Solobacterium sp.]|nr:ECF transporter S component [Solobacterium sp.]MBR3202206.1 ECF transporter S component [Solobacterium sp.]
MSETTVKKTDRTRVLTLTALFTGMNIALSSFGIPVPGGHLYLNDIVITAAALLLDPIDAFIVGGVGAFLGDLLFYPTPMFVSLVTHGLQAVVISLVAHRTNDEHALKPMILAAVLGALINVVGYTIGRAFVYATPEASLLKFPFQVLQAGVGAALGVFLVHRLDLKTQVKRLLHS